MMYKKKKGFTIKYNKRQMRAAIKNNVQAKRKFGVISSAIFSRSGDGVALKGRRVKRRRFRGFRRQFFRFAFGRRLSGVISSISGVQRRPFGGALQAGVEGVMQRRRGRRLMMMMRRRMMMIVVIVGGGNGERNRTLRRRRV